MVTASVRKMRAMAMKTNSVQQYRQSDNNWQWYTEPEMFCVLTI